VDVDYAASIVTWNVAYYGPPQCGRYTNIEQVAKAIPGSSAVELTNTNAERTARVIVPCKETWSGMPGLGLRVRLHAATGLRRDIEALLNGKDGVVFVADSAPERIDENVRSFAAAAWHPTPVVVQLNKRDLPGAMDAAEMTARLLKAWPPGRPKPVVIEATANAGRGVVETYRALLDALLDL
jgi:hypothetical protein